MTDFLPRDSKQILEWYTHPKPPEGQGCYVMFNTNAKIFWCTSGNEMKRVHELDPSKWLTGPIWLPLSVEDNKRVRDRQNEIIDNW